jgi:hypothetical protein
MKSLTQEVLDWRRRSASEDDNKLLDSNNYEKLLTPITTDTIVDLYAVGVILYLLTIILQRLRVWVIRQIRRREEERKSKLSKYVAAPSAQLEAGTTDQPVNLSGTWQLIENHNFEAFLEAQGVPYLLRAAANKARPLHIITHHGKQLTIQIKGIIESQTTYIIDGPPVTSEVRGRKFQDTVSYIENGVQVLKRCDAEQYTIRVCRRLSVTNEGRHIITLTSTALFDDHRPNIESFQVFEKVVR